MGMINRIYLLFGLMSFKRRLRFMFTCFTLAIVLLVSIPFVYLGKQQQRENAEISIDKMIDLQQVVIESWLDEKLSDIHAISQLPMVRKKDITSMGETLAVFDFNHTEFNGIVYVNEKGLSEVDTSGPTGIDLSDRIYFEKAKNGQSFITDVITGRQSNKPIIIFSVPVFDENERFNGLVFGAVPLYTMNEIMSEYQDKDRETFLVNPEGMIITESRQGKVGERINTEIYKEALKGNRLDHFYETKNSEQVMGDYRWVHNRQWLIIGEINEQHIYEPFHRMALIFSVVLVLLVVIGYLLTIRISNQVESPIRNVLIGTREIAKGNWGYRLSKSSYKNYASELQELSANFNHMARLIDQYIESIAKSEEQFRMITEYSSDMITIHDLQGKYLYVSPAGKEILQYNNDEIIGQGSYNFIHSDDIKVVKQKHDILLQEGYAVSTYRIRRKDGEYIWLESAMKFLPDKSNDEPQIFIISRNITERKLVEQRLQEANKKLQELSSKDGLTGVWNRRTFNEQLEIEWKRSKRLRTPLSLIMLDVDYFKIYNDTYGHLVGDDCLIALAKIMREIASTTRGIVCRYGGEEFSIILPETDNEGAKAVAESVRRAVEEAGIPHIGSQICPNVTMSFGTNTVIPSDNDTITQFIEGADTALYRAKQDGRNCVRAYQELAGN